MTTRIQAIAIAALDDHELDRLWLYPNADTFALFPVNEHDGPIGRDGKPTFKRWYKLTDGPAHGHMIVITGLWSNAYNRVFRERGFYIPLSHRPSRCKYVRVTREILENEREARRARKAA